MATPKGKPPAPITIAKQGTVKGYPLPTPTPQGPAKEFNTPPAPAKEPSRL